MSENTMKRFQNLTWAIEIEVHQEKDPGTVEQTLHKPGGNVIIYDPDYKIAQLLDKLGGDEGTITDPTGNKHYLSLKPYVGMDQNTTRIRIKYKSNHFAREQGHIGS